MPQVSGIGAWFSGSQNGGVQTKRRRAVATPAVRKVRYSVTKLKIGTLSVPIFSSDNLVSTVMTNSLGIPPRHTSPTRVVTIVLIPAVVVD